MIIYWSKILINVTQLQLWLESLGHNEGPPRPVQRWAQVWLHPWFIAWLASLLVTLWSYGTLNIKNYRDHPSWCLVYSTVLVSCFFKYWLILKIQNQEIQECCYCSISKTLQLLTISLLDFFVVFRARTEKTNQLLSCWMEEIINQKRAKMSPSFSL